MNILLIEDDSMHANYLKEIVHSAIPEAADVLIAENGNLGEIKARELNILSIVMDLRMKNGNGIEAARTIWSERPKTRILFWSNYSDEAYLRGVVQIVPEDAAYGYVLKTASEEKMRLALRAVLVESQIVVDSEVHQKQYRSHHSDNALTDGELVILLDLAIGLPDKEIAKRRNVSLRTVQNRLLILYDKLNVSGVDEGHQDLVLNKRVRAVSQAIKSGIINNESLEIAEKKLLLWIRDKH
ncbi:MAG: DNA-binding NarL/FixJ family response regulator [Granulosicoccus sp.]|jgi:DNA-binding NarL/FixJ family response regulator